MTDKVVIDLEKETEASILRGSLLEFTRFFYKHLYGRDFIISSPMCRESHQIILCRELTKIFRLESPTSRLLINIPPGHGKTLHLCMFVAWAFTHYPDCNFLYISFSHTLAATQTGVIKQIMSSKMYRYLFDNVQLRHDSRAKDNFETTSGGCVAAFGAQGAITGRNAGLPNLDRFTGCVIIDDPIKPDEAHSDTIRAKCTANYQETISQRPRGHNVPIIFIGQRLHEDDLSSYFIEGKDTREWEKVILQSLDAAGNALYPEVKPKDELLAIQEKSPYVWAAQHQQDPMPAGGALFKPEWFVRLDAEPDVVSTFITCDTAETAKTYNDATVFSFWGLYEIETFGVKTGKLGLHWIDCAELRIEPKDLEGEFLEFWQGCARYPVVPHLAAIEKKSTGTTLVSVMKDLRCLQVRGLDRTVSSGSKSDRFVDMQSYIAAKRVSIRDSDRLYSLCVTHMAKITANNTHRHDDIADTLYDAVKLALIDQTVSPTLIKDAETPKAVQAVSHSINKRLNAGARRYGSSS